MSWIPKRGVIGGLLTAAALALILSFKTPDTSGLTALGGNSQQGTGTTTGNTTNTTGSGAGAAATSGTRSTYSGTVTGQQVQTPFGVVQVQVTIQNGKITYVQAIQMPSDQFHSQQISQYAEPQLRSEVLSAQSSQVNTISGATYTSLGYLQSLQSALDQAGV